MGKENDSLSDWAKKGWILVNGKLVKAETQVAKRVDKIDPEKLADSFGRGLYGADLIPSIPLETLYNALTPNKKVRNATKSVENGVKFDSNLEKYLYNLLKGAQIDFEFQKVYLLQEKFRYRTEAVRAITLTVDFFLPTRNMIIDTKGWANDVSPLKYKMLKQYLYNENFNNHGGFNNLPEIVLPKNTKECDALLNRLMYNL